MLIYDINKSFEDNFSVTVDFPSVSQINSPPVQVLNKTLASPIGLAACPIAVSSKIIPLASLGFSLFTYKTIRSKAFAGYPVPNLGFVNLKEAWHTFPSHEKLMATDHMSFPVTAVNSVGICSLAIEIMQEDIAKAAHALNKQQVLSVSVYGVGENEQALAKDFAYTAALAIEAGAEWIELNFSCPNLGGDGLLYHNDHLLSFVIKTVRHTIAHDIPIIVKLGFIENKNHFTKILQALAKAGAQGVCGINTVPCTILNEKHQPYFGESRKTAGVSGFAIHPLACQFVRDAAEINQKEKLSLVILALGGVTEPSDFDHFLSLGADIAMTATAAIWRPLIAHEYLSTKRGNENDA